MEQERDTFHAASAGLHTRREFLKRSILAVTAASVPPGISSFYGRADAATRKTYSVVALTPESDMVTSLGESLFSGMKLHFGGSGSVRLSRRSFRGGEGAAVEAAKRAAGGGANLIVSFLSPEVARAVRDEVSGAVVINLHAGANVPREAADDLENTLSYWQSAWTAGRWAARNLGKRTVEVMSCYDSGYDAPYAFRVGFEEAGGEVVKTSVTHLPSEESPGFDAAIGVVRSSAPDFVYASYCGDLATDFLRAYAGAGLSRRIPILGSTFLTDAGGANSVGVRSFGTWASGSAGKTNRKFVSDYVAKHRRTPDSVAMLGYETAGIVTAALKKVGGRASGMRDALQSVSFDGPRGRATLGRGGRVYAREIKKTDGRYVNLVVDGFQEKAARGDQVPRVTEGPKTGWLDNYLVK